MAQNNYLMNTLNAVDKKSLNNIDLINEQITDLSTHLNECVNLLKKDIGNINDILNEIDITQTQLDMLSKQLLLNCDRLRYQKKPEEPKQIINKQFIDALLHDSRHVRFDFNNHWNGKHWNIKRDDINDASHLINVIKKMKKTVSNHSYYDGVTIIPNKMNITQEQRYKIKEYIKNLLK